MYLTYLYSHSSAPHTPRNDQNKIADILQYRKGDIHFCHRSPVKYLWDTFTGGAQAHALAAIFDPFRGIKMEPRAAVT